MVKNDDPDQISHSAAYDLGLFCLLRPVPTYVRVMMFRAQLFKASLA